MKNIKDRNDEILERISKEAKCNLSYVIFMGMSGILSAVALLTNSIPILIGAMVIAPGLSPLTLVAFALSAGEYKLAIRGFFTSIFGILMAVAFAMLVTWLLNISGIIPPDADLVHRPLIEERVRVGWYSVVAAFAAGISGAIATIKNKIDALVGTVASVALIPAGAAAGISFIEGELIRSIGGAALLGVNICLIIAMAIFTIVIIGPRREI